MWKVLSVAVLAGATFLVGCEEAEAAACMKIVVPAAGGGTTPLELLVPDSAIATYQNRGFSEVACPAGEVYTAERVEAACQKFAGFPVEAKDGISQTYGVPPRKSASRPAPPWLRVVESAGLSFSYD